MEISVIGGEAKALIDAIHRRLGGISEFSSLIVMIKSVLSFFKLLGEVY
jgi:hypothetical protein